MPEKKTFFFSGILPQLINALPFCLRMETKSIF